jgi:hypothetical protein
MAEDNLRELYRYMIIIHGPPELGQNSRELFETNEYGGGSISVYRVLEGRVPGMSTDVKHIDYAGGFVLRQTDGKTAEEFMKEIKEGLAKIVSSGK